MIKAISVKIFLLKNKSLKQKIERAILNINKEIINFETLIDPYQLNKNIRKKFDFPSILYNNTNYL